MKRFLFTGALALLCLAPATTSAQVTSSYVNVLCVVDPFTSDYTVEIYRQPGSVFVGSITNTQLTNSICTHDEQDLFNWAVNDLTTSGTMNGNDDTLGPVSDVFCPGPDNPTTIAQVMASMSFNTQTGDPQAGLVIDYYCPTSGGGGGGTPTTPTATYDAEICEDGHVLASAAVDGPNSINMVNVGPSSTQGFDTWEFSLLNNNSVPGAQSDLPSTVNHCDMGAADAAQDYLQANVGSLNPHDFGVDAWQCPLDELVVSVTSCAAGNGFATYGYRVDCCPPQIPPNAVVAGNNFSICLYPEGSAAANQSVSLRNPTYSMGPLAPIYNDPNTVCADMEADALAWFDANLPSGTPPCSNNWGAAAGGNYVPGTFSFVSCSVVVDQQQCRGDALVVRWRQEFACTP